MLTKITTLTLSCLAAIGFSAACAAEGSYNVNQINIPEKPEFMASLGIAKDAKPDLTKDQKTQLAGKAYHEKADQHFMSVHAQKGVSCNTCHDPRSLDGVAWMAVVNKPVIRQTCQDCHTVQADVFAHTDTHDKLDCIACHMPNMPKPAEYSEDQAKVAGTALYRAHMYKINPSPDKTSYVKKEVKVDGKIVSQYELAKDEKGRDFVDLMWSCARNAPADWTVFEGKGCHSQYTSKLEEGLVYKDQKQVYGELVKWQNPIKEGYKEIRGATERINKLLEVTRLDRDQRTQVLSYVDLATQIADMIEKDGSWGAHAHNCMTQRLAATQNYVRKAQEILDAGKFSKTAVDPLK